LVQVGANGDSHPIKRGLTMYNNSVKNFKTRFKSLCNKRLYNLSKTRAALPHGFLCFIKKDVYSLMPNIKLIKTIFY
jgi:hypothetical protein